MKEGYLQLKISELNDKCKKIDQMLTMEKSKIELLEERIGGLKDLIKKLKELDDFKDNILKELKKDYRNILEKEVISASKKVKDNTNSLVKSKTKEIEDILEYMKQREKEIDQQTEMISELKNRVDYLLKHNEILMMKLVNKGILSDREVNELNKRSSKKHG